MGLFNRYEEKQLARQERRNERRNEENKIGTAFTVNDDALADKIDNIITNNPTPLYTSVLDSSSTQGISTKVVTDFANQNENSIFASATSSVRDEITNNNLELA
ncbi:MAG: hypothetical protein R3Y50_06530, partial [Rikenellaceae bacterium]